MKPERLGTVTLPSGIVVVVDTGLLKLWSGESRPRLPEGILSSEEQTAAANAASDFRIEGRDAVQAGRALGKQPLPTQLYDFLPAWEPAILKDFAELTLRAGDQVRLVHRAIPSMTLRFPWRSSQRRASATVVSFFAAARGRRPPVRRSLPGMALSGTARPRCRGGWPAPPGG